MYTICKSPQMKELDSNSLVLGNKQLIQRPLESEKNNSLLGIKGDIICDSTLIQMMKNSKTKLSPIEAWNWYSKLELEYKNNILMFNAPYLIEYFNKILVYYKIGIKIELINEKDESSIFVYIPEKKEKIDHKNDNDFPENIFDKKEYENSNENEFLKDGRYNSFLDEEVDSNKEETQEDTNKDVKSQDEKIEMNLLKFLKFFSIETDYDILTFDNKLSLNSELLKKYLKYYSNNCCFQEQDYILPIQLNDEWYFPLPSWINSKESLSLDDILASIIELKILINYEYFCLTKTIYENSKINEAFKNKEEKINEFINYGEKFPDITKKIFHSNNLIYVANESNKNISELIKKKEFIFLYHKIEILVKLKNDIYNCKTNDEKIKKLFEEITSYDTDDIINSKYSIYPYFRKFLFDCFIQNYNDILIYENKKLEKLKINQFAVLEIEIEMIYKTILNNKSKLNPLKQKKIEELKETLKNLLDKDFEKIEFLEYGSYKTGLDIEISDIDILIYYQEKKQSLNEIQFGEKLYSLLQKEDINNLEIKKILYVSNNAVPRIILIYDISKEINFNLDLSCKYFQLDEITKIKIDLTFTNNNERLKLTNQMTEHINGLLEQYNQFKRLIFIQKIFFHKEKRDEVYRGGISSLCIIFFTKNIFIMNKQINNNSTCSEILLQISKKFSNYNYSTGIDENGRDFFNPYYYEWVINEIKGEKNLKRFLVLHPFIKGKNITQGIYKPEEIKAYYCKLSEHLVREKEIMNLFKDSDDYY